MSLDRSAPRLRKNKKLWKIKKNCNIMDELLAPALDNSTTLTSSARETLNASATGLSTSAPRTNALQSTTESTVSGGMLATVGLTVSGLGICANAVVPHLDLDTVMAEALTDIQISKVYSLSLS